MIRPLRGLKIAISISEAENLSDFGFPHGDRYNPINAVTVELCRRLIALGAHVMLGHQWRPGGIMEAVALFAQAYQWETGAPKEPIIHNFLAWPDRAALSENDRKQLGSLVAIQEEMNGSSHFEPQRRVLALRRMRKNMARVADASICLSGKVSKPSGFVSGLLEEAALMIMQEDARPVYLCGMMGGTAQLLINVLRGKCGSLEHKSILADSDMAARYLSCFDSPGSLQRFINLCGLEPSELDDLFDAQNLDTLIQLTARGLTNRVRFSKNRTPS